MALPVDVKSVEVLQAIRAQLCTFGEDAKNALAATDMEIGRMVDWLTNDRRLYWQGEIKRRKEDLSQARSELSRKRTSNMFGSEANLGEQRDLVREAQHKLDHAEEKLEKVRRWIQPLQQAVMEYRGRSRPLADMVDSDLQSALAMLDRMIAAIEDYSSTPATRTDYIRSFRDQAGPASPASEAPAESDPAPETPRGEEA